MKVVALVSGGKDSCYAMMRCLDYGHEIVALGNLLPVDESVDELDSFMYQTVGHQVVVAYAQCMGLPLYRRRICGSPRLQELRYRETESDEVEDLFYLLRAVQMDFPEVTAVSCGAIASDYQRMRVENVCSRLGLVSLAYLWKQDQDDLLQQMIAHGIHAVLIKVAAMGLNPNDHLGKSLSEMQTILRKLNTRFGINVCGEGGEYETLTLDCPLFKDYKIILDEFHVVQHSPDCIAPVGVLHPSKFHLKGKIPTVALQSATSIPFVKDIGKQFEDSLLHQNATSAASAQSNQSVLRNDNDISLESSSVRHDAFAIHSCWTTLCRDDLCIEEELALILTSIENELNADGLSWGNVLYIHLYLDDMETFATANRTYMQVITENVCIGGVPSRSTVGIDLLESRLGRIMVEAVVTRKDKKVLHVQSISCWAPSCIGPYSQATICCDMLYMAGQLGLDPPTMALVDGGAAPETIQALKNCEAIAQAFSVSMKSSCVSIIVYYAASVGITERQEAVMVLENFLQSIEHEHQLIEIPVLYVQVRALPKGAKIEVEPFLYAPVCDMESLKPCAKMKRFKIGDRCQGSVSPEQLLRTFYSVPLNVIMKETDTSLRNSSLGFEFLPLITREFELYLQAVSEKLAEVHLTWEDVLALRIMFAAKIVPRQVIIEAWSTAVNNYCSSGEGKTSVKLLLSGSQCVQPLFVPVLNSGRCIELSDLVTFDLLAFP